MPGMNGEAVAREIRRTHPNLPIIMLSGRLDIPERTSSAADAFVAKGQPPAVLLEYVATLACERTREVPLQLKQLRSSGKI